MSKAPKRTRKAREKPTDTVSQVQTRSSALWARYIETQNEMTYSSQLEHQGNHNNQNSIQETQQIPPRVAASANVNQNNYPRFNTTVSQPLQGHQKNKYSIQEAVQTYNAASSQALQGHQNTQYSFQEAIETQPRTAASVNTAQNYSTSTNTTSKALQGQQNDQYSIQETEQRTKQMAASVNSAQNYSKHNTASKALQGQQNNQYSIQETEQRTKQMAASVNSAQNYSKHNTASKALQGQQNNQYSIQETEQRTKQMAASVNPAQNYSRHDTASKALQGQQNNQYSIQEMEQRTKQTAASVNSAQNYSKHNTTSKALQAQQNNQYSIQDKEQRTKQIAASVNNNQHNNYSSYFSNASQAVQGHQNTQYWVEDQINMANRANQIVYPNMSSASLAYVPQQLPEFYSDSWSDNRTPLNDLPAHATHVSPNALQSPAPVECPRQVEINDATVQTFAHEAEKETSNQFIITEEEVKFLKILRAKRIDVSKLQVIVKNGDYIITNRAEPEEDSSPVEKDGNCKNNSEIINETFNQIIKCSDMNKSYWLSLLMEWRARFAQTNYLPSNNVPMLTMGPANASLAAYTPAEFSQDDEQQQRETQSHENSRAENIFANVEAVDAQPQMNEEIIQHQIP